LLARVSIAAKEVAPSGLEPTPFFASGLDGEPAAMPAYLLSMWKRIRVETYQEELG
jgi:hypothetical protein